MPFKIRGRDITEHQRPVCEMSSSQLLFDAPLACEEPIHGIVEIIGGGRLETQFFP